MHVVKTGVPSLVKDMQDYMQANPKRNPKYELLYNCTGHQSVMIMQSVPYCLKAAAFAVQEYEINQVIKYIEKI